MLAVEQKVSAGIPSTVKSSPAKELRVPELDGIRGCAVLLVLAWRTAGWWGIDRWLLPLMGTPWNPGAILGDRPGPRVATEGTGA